MDGWMDGCSSEMKNLGNPLLFGTGQVNFRRVSFNTDAFPAELNSGPLSSLYPTRSGAPLQESRCQDSKAARPTLYSTFTTSSLNKMASEAVPSSTESKRSSVEAALTQAIASLETEQTLRKVRAPRASHRSSRADETEHPRSHRSHRRHLASRIVRTQQTTLGSTRRASAHPALPRGRADEQMQRYASGVSRLSARPSPSGQTYQLSSPLESSIGQFASCNGTQS